MFAILFVLCVAVNLTVVPANVLPIDASTDDAYNGKNVGPIPANGVVYGLILNITSSDSTQYFDHVVELTEKSLSSGEELVRGKRNLNNIIGTALQSLQSDNWRECGRTRCGTTIYTNGIGTACFGACPRRVYCGYDNDGFDGDFRYGYQGRYDFGRINLG